jgi:hypothetical protein
MYRALAIGFAFAPLVATKSWDDCVRFGVAHSQCATRGPVWAVAAPVTMQLELHTPFGPGAGVVQFVASL